MIIMVCRIVVAGMIVDLPMWIVVVVMVCRIVVAGMIIMVCRIVVAGMIIDLPMWIVVVVMGRRIVMTGAIRARCSSGNGLFGVPGHWHNAGHRRLRWRKCSSHSWRLRRRLRWRL